LRKDASRQAWDAAKKWNPQIQLTARNATSIAHAQFTPCDRGLAPIQSVVSATNSVAYRSSPVSQYAWPRRVKCWQRLSSHGTLTSLGRSSSLDSMPAQYSAGH